MPSQPQEPRGDLRFVGAAEIEEMRGYAKGAARNMRRDFEDFPEPYQILRMGPIYLESEILAFFERHPELGRDESQERAERNESIRQRIRDGETNVSALARDVGVTRGLIYQVAGDLLRARR